MTALNAAVIAATSSAPQKSSMLTPGQDAGGHHQRATPVASHDTSSGNTRQRGRSGFHAEDFSPSGGVGLTGHHIAPRSRLCGLVTHVVVRSGYGHDRRETSL